MRHEVLVEWKEGGHDKRSCAENNLGLTGQFGALFCKRKKDGGHKVKVLTGNPVQSLGINA